MIQFTFFEINLITNILLYKHKKSRLIIIYNRRVGINVFISLIKTSPVADIEFFFLLSYISILLYNLYVSRQHINRHLCTLYVYYSKIYVRDARALTPIYKYSRCWNNIGALTKIPGLYRLKVQLQRDNFSSSKFRYKPKAVLANPVGCTSLGTYTQIHQRSK